MYQSASAKGRVGATPRNLARVSAAAISAVLSFAVVWTPQLNSQSGISAGNTSDQIFGTASDDNSAESGASVLSRGMAQQGGAISSSEIIGALQESPDMLVELKSQLATRLQQQGIQIDASEISDQTLYNQIATNPRLQASVATVLRARGIVSDDSVQSLASSSSIDQSQNASAQDSFSPGDLDLQNFSAHDRVIGEGTPGFGVSGGLNGKNSERVDPGPRRLTKSNSSTDEPNVVRQHAPFDFESMHDLYSQLPRPDARLERFGADVFVNRIGSAEARGIEGRDSPLDVPLGPDYIVGPGDRLTIDLWGGVTQAFTRIVDRDGRVLLPEAGPVQIAGLSLSKVQSVLEAVLRPQFRNAQVAVTVSGLRSVRVYVVGDVQRPGGYDISSLATPLSVLYAAGGPTAVGSLRSLRHLRGSSLVEEIDLYDFLLNGIRSASAPFQSGDTLLIPPAGPQIAISGAVKRPAIYELRASDTNLATIFSEAGGLTSAASLTHITIERVDKNQQRETVTLTSGEDAQLTENAIENFHVKDGDRIRIEPILPYSQRVVYLSGHVARPGRRAYIDGMRLADVLHSYQDMLPEPAVHGEIVRLIPPDLHAETIEFDVQDLLGGKSNPVLNAFDTVRIFSRYQTDAPMVTIRGEVLRPGDYPMFRGMTAAKLVRMAGGFKRDALTESADLTSYEVENGREITEKLTSIRIGAAISGADPKADIELKPGDILAVHQITNWANIGESVTIQGQVRYPGSYGFQDGERLSSVLRRAGGMLQMAYPAGAVLTRSQVKGLEESSRDALVRQIQANSAAARLSPGVAAANSSNALQLIKAQQDQVLAELQNHPPTGRMVIHISADIDSWANTAADIELRPGDELTIPKRPGFVLVTGQVYNASALTFIPGKTAGWYLSRAGGTSASANRKEVFVIRANGTVVGRRSGGMFNGDVLSTKLYPGDVVVVPQKILGGSLLWRNLLTAGQLAASTAITAGVAAAAL